MIPILTGPIVLIIMLVVKKFPPKKINSLYGYRTKRSMARQEAWDFVQVYSTEEMIKYMIFYTLTSVIGLFLGDSESVFLVFLALLILIIFMAIPIVKTEKELKQRFG